MTLSICVSRQWKITAIAAAVWCALPAICLAQSALTLQQAVDEALASRPSLKADAARIAVAEGERLQAGARANPEFQFQNENLRSGQSYSRDVDTMAIVTQPIDVFGRRSQRLAVADRAVALARNDHEVARVSLVVAVTTAYWEAREAQEVSRVLSASVTSFQQVVQYHEAQLRAGTVAEQDVLRVRLERERLSIAAGVAAIDAARKRWALLSTLGRSSTATVELTEPIEAALPSIPAVSDDEVLRASLEVGAAEAAVAEAEAAERLEVVNARPELDAVLGFKRTQLPDTTTGVNTMIAGLRISLPFVDRNRGNRAAAGAEVQRRQQLLNEARANVLGRYHAALEDFNLQRSLISEAANPLREHAVSLATIAQAAFRQGGTDLLRLLDADRARLDAEVEWVHAMADFQQSAATLKFAQGAIR